VAWAPSADAAGTDLRLVWHVENAEGRVLDSREADLPINPASVIKVATSLWALERLGPDHRFETRFAARGSFDPQTGVLDGDLLVFGGDDPDFHVENAYLVAQALNREGLRSVRGSLLVDEGFWIGWEGGSERKTRSAERRAATMATRLRDALDPGRWSRRTRHLLGEFASRRGLEGDPPRVSIEGGVGRHAEPSPEAVLIVHRSNPLRRTLKRFNAYSNNDIERLGPRLGSPDDLAATLATRWEVSPATLSLETLSGLGSNRMTPRHVVRLLRDLDRTCRRLGLRVEDLLPAAGCDPGTLERFPSLEAQAPGALVAKTGTLARTDGGVAAIAGLARTAEGDRLFCVAAPRSGGRLARAREAEERWVLDLLAGQGGARPGACGDAVGYSDDDARAAPPRLAVPSEWRFDLDAEPAVARGGMVVTADRHATDVGVEILARGGNAVDAAVATAFALAVTYPTAGNIGGGGFMVVRLADGETAALDFREKAPLAATRDMYLEPDGAAGDRSLYGPLAAGVPGSVRGLWEAHRRFGTMDWAQLVEPAIRLAGGFEVHPSLHDGLTRLARRIGEFDPARRAQFQGTLDQFLPGGSPPAVGTVFSQPDLTGTLRRIADRGPAGFYSDETARLIVAEMKRGGGVITLRDLDRYTAEWREPIVFDYRGYTVISMPPVSSGGATMAELANILEGYRLEALPFDSDERVHLLAEAMKRAFSDRNTYLGDPAFVRMPLERMLSEGYAAERRSEIDRAAATPSSAVGPALGPVDHGSDTTHFSIVDRHRNAVAVTTTINTAFGSLVTVPGAGFLLNNEMDDFAVAPGSPNVFGLVQGEANAIVAGKRMLSSMTPTIVLDHERELWLVTGSPDGPRIITAVLQSISNAIDYRMNVSALVNAPRVHHQHLPDHIVIEKGGFSGATLEGLRALGHEIREVGSMGSVQAIMVSPDGTLTGAADPRGAGLARGVSSSPPE
jgi:gamma-glutamyltranspeptidase/glutathione hydrolase